MMKRLQASDINPAVWQNHLEKVKKTKHQLSGTHSRSIYSESQGWGPGMRISLS